MTLLLLASASQRRHSWLSDRLDGTGTRITTQPLVSAEPGPGAGLEVGVQAEATCLAKAEAAAREMTLSGDSGFDLVVVADTLVEDPEDPLVAMGKPDDVVAAAAMLLRLSGRRHRVWSSTALLYPPDGQREGTEMLHRGWSADVWTDSALVEFEELSEDQLVELVRSESWLGKAGAYDLAGRASQHARLIEGSEVTVLGFATSAMDALLGLLD
mgnify:FL=1